MNFIEAWDIGARDGMEQLHRHEEWLTPPMHFITSLGNNQVVAVVALLAMLFFLFIGRWRTGVCLLAAGLLAASIEYTVKPLVHRSRPDLKWVLPQDKKTTPSFPSGHAILAMAVYGSLALSLAAQMESRTLKGLIVVVGFVLVLLIGFSRLYLGVHYLSDVVGGFCAGLACLLLFRWIDLKWTAAVQPKLAVEAIATPFQPAPAPKAREQIQRSSSEDIQS